MVGIGALLSVPFGMLTGVFLCAVAPESRLAQITKFVAQVLTGFPSILAGVFVFGFLVVRMGTFSAIALGVLMLPATRHRFCSPRCSRTSGSKAWSSRPRRCRS